VLPGDVDDGSEHALRTTGMAALTTNDRVRRHELPDMNTSGDTLSTRSPLTGTAR